MTFTIPGDVLAEGHLEDLGMGSVLISASSSVSLERWNKFLTGLSCFSLFASFIIVSIGIHRHQFLRWGSLGLFMGIVLPNLSAWWLVLKLASSPVADAVIEARRATVTTELGCCNRGPENGTLK